MPSSTKDLGFYLWACNNLKNADYVLERLRQNHQNSDLIISSDNGKDFSEVAKCRGALTYVHGRLKHGYPFDQKRYGWTTEKAFIWLERVYLACLKIRSTYVMLMEEDVLIRSSFTFPESDLIMIPEIKNPISSAGMEWISSRGGNTEYPYYSSGGGSIINREKFIYCYEKNSKSFFDEFEEIYLKSMEEGKTGWGWNDSIICVLMFSGGSTFSTDLPITENGLDEGPIPIIHKFKKYYE